MGFIVVVTCFVIMIALFILLFVFTIVSNLLFYKNKDEINNECMRRNYDIHFDGTGKFYPTEKEKVDVILSLIKQGKIKYKPSWLKFVVETGHKFFMICIISFICIVLFLAAFLLVYYRNS